MFSTGKFALECSSTTHSITTKLVVLSSARMLEMNERSWMQLQNNASIPAARAKVMHSS